MNYKTSLHALMLICTLLLLLACNSNGGKKQTIETGVKATLAETLDTVLAANINDDDPGMIVSVWQDDVNLYTGMKGIARPMEPITEHTQFRLASVSKTFTAIAVLKLYEQGLIDLQASILDYMPELDASWQHISIHHLLAHQSGIPDFFNDLNAQEIIAGDFTNTKIVQYFIDNPSLEFIAGSKEDYSNTGYMLLAIVVSRVTGESFSEFMEKALFTPLAMNSSYILEDFSDITASTAMNFADNHKNFGRNSYTYGSSAQVSSMIDMQRFVYAFMTGQVLQPDSKNLMLTSYSSIAESLFNGTGYGIFYYSEDGKTTYGHNGGADGFRTIYAINKDKNAFIIVLGNGGDTMPDYQYIMNLAGEFL